MTREEAIKGLNVLAKDFSGYRPNEEMFNMAIKALEQQEAPMKAVALELTEEEYQRIQRQMKTAPMVLTPTVPIDVAYAKIVWEWLMDYQMKSAELNGRYSPYEVLSWVGNDWRKEFIEGREG